MGKLLYPLLILLLHLHCCKTLFFQELQYLVYVYNPDWIFLSPYKAVGHPIELESNVVCMTYASLVRLEDNEIPTGYDLLIFDECHRCGATLTLPMCNKLIKSNPGCKRILSDDLQPCMATKTKRSYTV